MGLFTTPSIVNVLNHKPVIMESDMDDQKKGTGEKGFVMSDGEKIDPKSTRMPLIDFSTFIFSLNSSALVHLGIISEPGSDKKMKSLPLAKQTIDILGMLQEKTKGNLTNDEENLFKNMLHDLRLMYVREKDKA